MPDLTLVIDQPEAGTLRLALERDGQVLAVRDLPLVGHVDNLLLTGVDKLLQENTIDKSALSMVLAGQGIDKNSSSYRMVTSFAAAIMAASAHRQARQE